MSYNGSGTFNINSAGQPVVTGTTITSTAFNALTADLATGLSTAITKDGQTATTARIPFVLGVSSTLTTDATSATTGSIITAGGISAQKALWVGTTANVAGTTDATSATTGTITTAGGISAQKALWVGTNARVVGNLSSGTATINGGSATTSGTYYTVLALASISMGISFVFVNNNQNGYSGMCVIYKDSNLNVVIASQANQNAAGCTFQVSSGDLQVRQTTNNAAILSASYTFTC
jgi:hypothetical protein